MLSFFQKQNINPENQEIWFWIDNEKTVQMYVNSVEKLPFKIRLAASIEFKGAAQFCCFESFFKSLRQTETPKIILTGNQANLQFWQKLEKPETGFVDSGNFFNTYSLFQIPALKREILLSETGFKPEPGVKEKMQALTEAVKIAGKIGDSEPVAALLSAVEVANPAMKSTADWVMIKAMYDSGQMKGFKLLAPMSFDCAVSEEVSAAKKVKLPGAGNANILMTENLRNGRLLKQSIASAPGVRWATVTTGGFYPVISVCKAMQQEEVIQSLKLATLML